MEATSSAMLLLISQSEHDSFSMLMQPITQTGNNSQLQAININKLDLKKFSYKTFISTYKKQLRDA